MRRREDRNCRLLCYLRGRLPRLGALRLDERLRLCLGLGLGLGLRLRGCRGYLRTFVFYRRLGGWRGWLGRIDRMLGVPRVEDQVEGRLVVEGVPIVIFRLRDLRRTFLFLVLRVLCLVRGPGYLLPGIVSIIKLRFPAVWDCRRGRTRGRGKG